MLLLLVVGVVLTVFVSRQQQHYKQKAAETNIIYPANMEFDPPGRYLDGSYNIASLTNPNVAGVVINFSWAAVEPQQGVFNFAPQDKEIADWVAVGKKVAFQVRFLFQGGHRSCTQATTQHDLPTWEVTRIQHFCDTDKGMIIPDYFDPTFQADAKAFVSVVAQHYANSPYKGSIVYVRVATGTGGEQNLLMYCPSKRPACDYPTDVKQLITYGYGNNASAIYAYDQNMLSYYKNAFSYTTVMYADNTPFPFGATIIRGVNLNTNPATGNQVGFDISKWAVANGMGIGYMGLGPKSSFDSFLDFDQIISYVKTNYPHSYVHFQMGGKMSSASDVQDSITNAMKQYARTIEWYAQDIDNPAYQPYLAQWQTYVNNTFGGGTTPSPH